MLLGDGEMYKEKVEIVEAPGVCFDMGHLNGVAVGVVVIPELRGDEEVGAGDQAFADGALDALAGLDAVFVAVSSVYVAIARFDGVVDGVCGLLWGDLPKAETDLGDMLMNCEW